MTQLPPVMDRLASGVVVVDARARARVLLRGADARVFLHRMSTQHVKDLQAGDGRLNALLTDKGRLVDLVLHLDRGDAGVLLVGSPGRGPAITAWLDRYLFTEKVELDDHSAAGAAFDVCGAGAPAVVDAIAPQAGALPPWGFVERDCTLVARGFDRVTGAGERVPGFVVVQLGGSAPADLGSLAADTGAEDAEIARIAAGVPGSAEITDAFTPLDLGMHDAVHWAKGCYIGQEVIARLDTYGKQRKRLVVIEGARLAAGDAVLGDGDAVLGAVTSAADGRALAVVKLADDGPVRVKSAGGAVVEARASTPRTAQQPHA